MKKMVSLLLVAFTLISTGLVVFAGRVENVGGGTWVYGVRHIPGGKCFSNYEHPSLYHGSTAVNGNGDKSAPHMISPGVESKASVKSTSSGNKAYWHRCNIDKECGGRYNR